MGIDGINTTSSDRPINPGPREVAPTRKETPSSEKTSLTRRALDSLKNGEAIQPIKSLGAGSATSSPDVSNMKKTVQQMAPHSTSPPISQKEPSSLSPKDQMAAGLSRVQGIRSKLDASGFAIVTGPSSTGKTEQLELAIPSEARTAFNLKTEFLEGRHGAGNIPNTIWREEYYAIKEEELNWLVNNKDQITGRLKDSGKEVIVFDEFDLMMTGSSDTTQKAIYDAVIEIAKALQDNGQKVVFVAHEAFLADAHVQDALDSVLGVTSIEEQTISTGSFTREEETTILSAAGFDAPSREFIMRHANGVAAVYIDLLDSAVKGELPLQDEKVFIDNAKRRVGRLLELTKVEPRLAKTVEATSVLGNTFSLGALKTARYMSKCQAYLSQNGGYREVALKDETGADLKILVPQNKDEINSQWNSHRDFIAQQLGQIDPVDCLTNPDGTPGSFQWENSFDAPEDLHAAATKEAGNFMQRLSGAAGNAGARVTFGPSDHPVKSLSGLKDKVENRMKWAGDKPTTKVNDCLRGTVIARNISEMKAVLAELQKMGGENIAFSNKFTGPGYDEGYVAIHARLKHQCEDGGEILSEIQIHFEAIENGAADCASQVTHKAYELVRTLSANDNLSEAEKNKIRKDGNLSSKAQFTIAMDQVRQRLMTS